MNLYFSPTEHYKLHVPVSQLSTNIFENIKNKIEETREINTDSIINHDNDNLKEEDIEMLEFHEKYTSELSTFKKTEANKKLNKIKIYFIVKSKIVKGQELNFAIPIRGFDNLGHSRLEKFHSFINILFEIGLYKNYEGSPEVRPFSLERIIVAADPYGLNEEFSLEDLVLPKQYGPDGIKIESDISMFDMSRLRQVITRTKKGKKGSIYYLSSDYHYTESMVDNTVFTHTSKYVTDGKKTKENTFVTRAKAGFKIVISTNPLKLIFGNRNSVKNKNIIPVFSSLEDAQDLLITVLEEVNEPFQVRRKMEGLDTNKYDRSLDYLDDPFCYQNRYFNPENVIEKFKEFLRTYRFIKARKRSSLKDDYYHENKYQTKGPFCIIDPEPEAGDMTYEPLWLREQANEFAPRHIWRESDCLLFQEENFLDDAEVYSLLESRDMSIADKVLLKNSQDVKIISMGLADFLGFWNNPTTKNGEVLFIPSSKDLTLNKRGSPVISKKPIDPFYEYQQKFRESKKKDTENYTYEIIVSPN
ncbi:unnamed protein product [Ectocarpus fasciculatus]